MTGLVSSGKTKIIALTTSFMILFNAAGITAFAAQNSDGEEVGKGRYVKDVFISYGKTEKDAKNWLVEHNWEPINGDCDLNKGKASFFDDNAVQDQNVAAVMGIRRTEKAEEAITDMAVMNMKGGYSIPDYESLLKQKRSEIKEMVERLHVVISEYRDNYNGKGSDLGKKRAKTAYDILNRFYDGGKNEQYAANDTGEKLGDLLLKKTRSEGNKNGGDLEQIMLESSGPAALAVQVLLALSADPGKETWLERLTELTGDELAENLPKYVPEAGGQDIAPSASVKFLKQHYGDTAEILADEWTYVHDELVWFSEYSSDNDLWKKDSESDDDHTARVKAYFDELIKEKGTSGEDDRDRYDMNCILHTGLYDISYEGKWGETLGDFFFPADTIDMSDDQDAFLPMAAALSEGQRASLDHLSLNTLLLMGMCSEKGFEQALPDIKDIFGGKTQMSIYTGVDRGAFRGGVALTDRAMMEENMGRGAAYDQIWGNMGIAAISSYSAAVFSISAIIGGAVMKAKGYTFTNYVTEAEYLEAKASAAKAAKNLKNMEVFGKGSPHYKLAQSDLVTAEKRYNYVKSSRVETRMGVAGRWLMGIGGALLIGASAVKGVQLYKYYKRTMLPIPSMIVDEADIVTYGEDENGSSTKSVDFATYEYYTAVKCNRQDVGEIGDWQSGVKEYKEKGCGDLADINSDMGKEWLALYTARSGNKGKPVLADSLTLQYGNKDMPEGCTKALHLFTYENALDLGDTAYAYNNEMNGIYLFWDEKSSSTDAASAFSSGRMAIAGMSGLAAGILITTFVLMPKRKKEEFE